MRIIVCCLLAVAAAGTALAQGSPEGWLVPFAAAYQPRVAGFNRQFDSLGFPGASSRHYGWGIELRSLVSGFLIGPMFFRTWDDVESDRWQLRTDATGIFGNVGLKLAPADFIIIVPSIGLGGLNQSFTIREKSSAVPIESLNGGAPEVISMSPGMKLAGLASLELDLTIRASTGRYGLSLRGGYLYSPLGLTWRLANGAEVRGTPSDKLGGPFFSAGILIMPDAQTSAAQ